MKSGVFVLAGCLILSGLSPVLAQEKSPIPPENAMKLSQIVASIEQRQDFRYLSNIEWNDDGYYDITYFTADEAKVEIRMDAVSGKPVPMR